MFQYQRGYCAGWRSAVELKTDLRTLTSHLFCAGLGVEALFVSTPLLNDASNPGHFNWHIYTRCHQSQLRGSCFERFYDSV
jgi:hypothetical protein